MKQLPTIAIFGAATAALVFASYVTTIWGGSGGFSQLEYELTFKDLHGEPVENVELKVEDQRGKEFYCFPVTDYVPGRAPRSDKDGVMRFHHVISGVEWDTYGWSLFWYFPVQTRSPQYVCRFLHNGEEVHQIPYRELSRRELPGRGREDVTTVKRQWNWSATIPDEIRYRPEDTGDSHYSRVGRFFHADGEGRLNREATVARNNAMRLLLKLEVPLEFGREAVEDIEFPVIRRTITVTVPNAGR